MVLSELFSGYFRNLEIVFSAFEMSLFHFRNAEIMQKKRGNNAESTIPIKMEDFFDAEISIYSRAEFFIYLFEDFIQRFSNETRCP